MENRWIPVNEKLPEEFNGGSPEVIVTVKDEACGEEVIYCSEDHTENGKWLNYNDNGFGKVIAWMSFPEPYKEEK